ncbi:hypothetical protein BJY01DRAFT_57555 [Aspergillus pseudoustus]|uniref:Uncharacterized protein n=1 Tax=Aspergillus pseudoustus TaxID=1810923 RepID=A0ABR4KNF2_9EURO
MTRHSFSFLLPWVLDRRHLRHDLSCIVLALGHREGMFRGKFFSLFHFIYSYLFAHSVLDCESCTDRHTRWRRVVTRVARLQERTVISNNIQPEGNTHSCVTLLFPFVVYFFALDNISVHRQPRPRVEVLNQPQGATTSRGKKEPTLGCEWFWLRPPSGLDLHPVSLLPPSTPSRTSCILLPPVFPNSSIAPVPSRMAVLLAGPALLRST